MSRRPSRRTLGHCHPSWARPPEELADEEPLALLDRAYAGLRAAQVLVHRRALKLVIGARKV